MLHLHPPPCPDLSTETVKQGGKNIENGNVNVCDPHYTADQSQLVSAIRGFTSLLVYLCPRAELCGDIQDEFKSATRESGVCCRAEAVAAETLKFGDKVRGIFVVSF